MGFLTVIVVLQIACVIHCINKGRNPWWIVAILVFPLIGSAAYFAFEVLGGRARRELRIAREAAVRKIDPDGEVRAAAEALDTADTAANRIAMGDALAGQRKWWEAAEQYREALAKSPLGDRPTQMKLAKAWLEAGEPDEALRLVETLPETGSAAERDRAESLRAQALGELGRTEEALAILRDVGTRMPGGEAQCREAALLIADGRDREAAAPLAEAVRRAKSLDRYEKVRDRDMYAWAEKTLAELRARGL
ncbi:MAG TPA: tetratricopeptide repeat protein [Allosphingosinicella sp.]|jgi:hypothetical protein